MRADVAERRVKAVQKGFLLGIEEHPVFHHLEPEQFNLLRRRVFRATFDAYRLGVVGVDGAANLYDTFFRWLPEIEGYLTSALAIDLRHLCFRTTLAAFRLGAMVADARDGEEGA